jgi:integrase/recombinase XerD
MEVFKMDRLPCSHYLQSLISLSETSRDQLSRYLQALRARNYAESTLGVVAIIIKRLFRYLPAPRNSALAQNFTQVTPADIDAFLAAMQAGELAPATIGLSLTILKGFFEFLRETGELQVQPVFKHRHTIMTPTHLPKPMTEADVVSFFKVIDSARDRLLFLLMLRCGLRVSEVCALTWKDIDLTAGTALILNGKGKVDRVAYLSPDVEQALRLWQQVQKPSSGYLFPGQKPRQGPLVRHSVNGIMRAYLRQAGIETDYSPHCLRHTFATQLLNAGVRLEVLKELMGHRALHMTLRYTELYEVTKRQQYDEAMEQIEQRQAVGRR